LKRRTKYKLRDKEIVEKTIEMLSQHGFFDLRMSDLAKETNYSMGTIYSHFASKEDLLLACAHSIVLEYKKLFDAIVNQPITGVEKIITLAHCMWYISMNHPALREIIDLSLMPSVSRRGSEQRTGEVIQLYGDILTAFLDLVHGAIKKNLHGHDQLNQTQTKLLAHQLAYGSWSFSVELSSIIQFINSNPLNFDGGDEKYASFSRNYCNFLKGYGWQEENSDAIFKRCNAIAQQCISEITLLFA